MLNVPTASTASVYLDQCGIAEYLDHLSEAHPDLYRLLSAERCADAARHVVEMNMASWEFESDTIGGRGSAYNLAQRSAVNRSIGMTALLDCFSTHSEGSLRGLTILDVLGGDGTLARFCKSLGDDAPAIITADISRFMIDACRAHALPCIRQSAARSLFRDDVLDGVLIAYGSHHLGRAERQLAVCEAHRTLRPGGRLVLHDFETGGASAQWFAEVVNRYSRTGHPHPHFSRSEMLDLFTDAGFADIRIFTISDAFTLHGGSPQEAIRNATMHMYDMYDLIKLGNDTADLPPRLERLIQAILGPISVEDLGGRFVAKIPREALVAVGTKRASGAN
jgi:ubiquinone/menaquinone biosynthesis C-methylase UbiE